MRKTYRSESIDHTTIILTILLAGVIGIGSGFLIQGYLSMKQMRAELEEVNKLYEQRLVSQGLYKSSIELMNGGYKDYRPEYVIDDAEYVAWRDETLPIYNPYEVEMTSKDLPIEIKVDTEDYITVQDYNYVVDCLDVIPENFLQKCADDGWIVEIKKDYISEGDGTVTMGQTNHETKELIVSTQNLSCIYHEFGHILARYADEELQTAGLYEPTTQTELGEMYCHSANGSVYIYMNAEEQIAESFYDYLFYPREMQEQAPMLYGIYENTLSNM